MKTLLAALLLTATTLRAGPVGPPAGNPLYNSNAPQQATMNITSGTLREQMDTKYAKVGSSLTVGVSTLSVVNGQVGIGTNTPHVLLDVYGDANIAGNLTGPTIAALSASTGAANPTIAALGVSTAANQALSAALGISTQATGAIVYVLGQSTAGIAALQGLIGQSTNTLRTDVTALQLLTAMLGTSTNSLAGVQFTLGQSTAANQALAAALGISTAATQQIVANLGVSTNTLQAVVAALGVSTQATQAVTAQLGISTAATQALAAALGVSSAATQSLVFTLGQSTAANTASIAALSASTVSLQNQVNAIPGNAVIASLGVSTAALNVSTQSLQTQINGITSEPATVAALGVSTQALNVSTQSLQSQLDNVASNNPVIAALGVSTAATQATVALLGTSTNSLQSQLVSVGVSTAATQATVAALGVSTAAKVNRAGDAMTGPLAVTTLTVSGNAFSVGGTTLVVVSGQVGIGLTNPALPLDVNGAIRTNSSITGSAFFGDGSNLTGVPGPANMMTLDTVQTSTAAKIFTGTVAVTGLFGVSTNTAVGLYVVASSGNVGIGVTAPSVSNYLEVGGPVQLYDDVLAGSTSRNSIMRFRGSGQADLRLQSASDGFLFKFFWSANALQMGTAVHPQSIYVDGATGQIGMGNAAPSGWGLRVSAGDLLIDHSASISGSSFSVAATTFVVAYGQVGVGTSDPQAKLNLVDGDLMFSTTTGSRGIRFQDGSFQATAPNNAGGPILGATASSFTATAMSGYGIDTATGINVRNGRIDLSTGGYIKFGDGTVLASTANISTGGGGSSTVNFSSNTGIPSANVTASVFGECIPGSTMSFTASGTAPITVGFTGNWANSGSNSNQFAFLMDGASVTGNTMELVRDNVHSGVNLINGTFLIAGVTPGPHSFCLSFWTGAGTLSWYGPGDNLENQFWARQ